MFDILTNHKVGLIKSYAELATGNETKPTAGYIDMWDDGQLPNRALIIVDVGACAGTLVLTFQDSTDNSSWDTDFAVAATISEAGLYLVDLVDFYRYLRLYAVAAGGNASYGAYLVTFEDQRRPVTQEGDTLALTYGTGRKPKVAAS